MDNALEKDLAELTLRLGDDALVLGQRLCEWCGHAPSVEIDLALSNLGLDLIGQARHFLSYAGELEGKGRDEDTLAFTRDVLDFKNCLLVEQPNGDFAQTMVRHFLYTTWQALFLQKLAKVSDETLSAVAQKSVKEITYHAMVSADWIVRLGDGTEESRTRTINGLHWMWRFKEELFSFCDDIQDLCNEIGLDCAGLKEIWHIKVTDIFKEATLDCPEDCMPITGGRYGHHTEHLGHLLAEMQFLQRAYPGAQW